MQTFWRSQFDKLLMTGLVVLFCGLSLFGYWNEKMQSFALQAASGCLGCIFTLVTARRPSTPDAFLEPTSSSSSTTTTSKTETVAPQEPPVK
jgi:hypothetical protein